jgi:NTE family protein
VIQSLIRARIPIDYVAGASIGAVVGAAFCAGQIDVFAEEIRRLGWRGMASMLDIALPRTGLLAGKKIVTFIRHFVHDRAIEELAIPFCAVATNLHTGREVWLRHGSTVEAVRASLSLPGIFTPVRRGTLWLVDGGLTNPVPVSVCRAMGADVVIAVNLNADMLARPFGRAEKTGRDTHTPQDQRLRQAFRRYWQQQGARFRQRLPLPWRSAEESLSIFEVLLYSLHVMQDRITRQRLASDPPDVQIAPALRHIQLWEFHRADEAIAEGERAAQAMLPTLRESLVQEGLLGEE